MEYRILGPVAVRAGDAQFPVGGPREQRSLVALLLNANRVVSVDRLVEVLWGDAPPRTAGTQIRNTMTALRRNLAPATNGVIPVTRSGAGFVIQVGEAQLDVLRFDRHVQQARLLTGQGQLAAAAAELHAALRLWRGPALGGLGAPVLDIEARGLEEQRLSCLEQRIELDLALGWHGDVVGELVTLAQEHPLRERLAELQVLALYGAGRRQEALAAVAAARARLAEDAGLDPGPELVRLQQAILRGEEAQTPPAVGVRRSDAGYVRPAQLPADAPAFTGRAAHLRQLDDLLTAREVSGPTVVISSIGGTAGVGKTALAVHWAHRVRDRFSDGQLYLNLRGFDPGGAPLPPTRALRALLDALGVAPERIPPELEAQVGLYRSLMAGRRVLVVLDNARDAEQVRPLLPGTASCLVVVTSRNLLSGLVAVEGARPLTLDLLSPDEARELLARRLGATLTLAEPDAVDAIVASCVGLPLALVIVAARAATRPGLTLTALVDELIAAGRSGVTGRPDATGRLDALRTGDPHSDIRKVFSWSYDALSDAAQRLFRLLGLHPGADLAVPAAASLAGITIPQAKALLAELAEAQLVVTATDDRYTMHDLLRAYAVELVESDVEHDAAIRQMLDHYLCNGYVAALRAYPTRDPLPLHETRPAGTPTPDLADRNQADRWLDTELANLLAAAQHAATHGWPEHTWQLSAVLDWHLRTRGRFREAETLHQHALNAARHLGNHPAEMNALNSLGDVHRRLGRHEQAGDHYERALQIAQATGDRSGELQALTGLGQVHRRLGRHEQAGDHFGRALQIAQATGDRSGELYALTGLGDIHRLLGRHEQAGDHYERALQIAHAIGDRVGELQALTGLGDVHRRLGRQEQAGDHFGRALQIAQAIGNRVGELTALAGLGLVHRMLGRQEQAGDHYERALQIAQATGDRGGELQALTGLGHVHRTLGRHSEAADCYQQVFDLAGELGSSNWQFEALQGLGRLHHATGHPDRALTHHEQALQYATDLAQPEDQARAHDGLAHACHALNNHDQARSHWQHALDILTSLGTDHTEEIQTSVPNIRANLNQQPPTATD